MHAIKLLTGHIWQRGLSLVRTAMLPLFLLGIGLGLVAVSLCQQWNLTFGQDPQFLLAQSLILASACWFGKRWQSSPRITHDRWSLTWLIGCLAAWVILNPLWLDTLTILMGSVPIYELESRWIQSTLAILIAALVWTIPGLLWTAAMAQAVQVASCFQTSPRLALACMLSGTAYGLALGNLIVAPWLGVYLPAVAVSIAVCVGSMWFCRQAACLSAFVPRRQVSLNGAAMRCAMACLAGGLLAGNLRLANQLLPHCTYVLPLELAGVLMGIGAGLILRSLPGGATSKVTWGGLLAAASASLLFALQPNLVHLSLRMNVAFSTVVVLLTARTLLLMMISFPFGVALAWIVEPHEADAAPSTPGWAAPFAIGLGCGTFLLGGHIDVLAWMTVCSGLLTLSALIWYWRSCAVNFSWRTVSGLAVLLLTAAPLPWLGFRNDPDRTSKLLFSAPSFIAYRAGWDVHQLPYLDDVRLIDQREGLTGPLTLFRGRVAELYLREAGVPRAVISADPTIVPQYPTEVLQIAYPLLLSERPAHLLFLGIGSGTSIAASLAFPIQDALCFEGDANLIDMVRGPVAQATGFDPLSDERVSLRRIAPELALMAEHEDRFDVILSNPLTSSMPDGSSAFTQEFYQRASRLLSQRGIFCQRVECIDYGPRPLQLTLKAIRSAFQRVIAIELAAGQLLVMGTNTPQAIVTNELPARLEQRHVRRLLAQSGLDWCTLLNFPTYDEAAIDEICGEYPGQANSAVHGQLAAFAPLELMRWGNKQGEVQQLLTAPRKSDAPYLVFTSSELTESETNSHRSRRSRLLDWLDESHSTKELTRRLGEVAQHQKTILENPDQHWWSYRGALKKHLRNAPRSTIQQVKSVKDAERLHPEDEQRFNYISDLSAVVTQEKPTRSQIAALESHFEPYDPMISYFCHQECADLLARAAQDPALELRYRLHVIFFAPTIDASVRNVAKAVATLVNHPAAVPSNSDRFDILNGLVQILRIRWEIRQNIKENSSQKILDDVDLCLVALENAVSNLETLAGPTGIPAADWQARRDVIERLTIRPLRSYRSEVQSHYAQGRARTRSIIEEADQFDDSAEE